MMKIETKAISNFVLAILAFFDYWIDEHIKKERKIVTIILQLFFSLFFSIPIGFIIFIFTIVSVPKLTTIEINYSFVDLGQYLGHK